MELNKSSSKRNDRISIKWFVWCRNLISVLESTSTKNFAQKKAFIKSETNLSLCFELIDDGKSSYFCAAIQVPSEKPTTETLQIKLKSENALTAM